MDRSEVLCVSYEMLTRVNYPVVFIRPFPLRSFQWTPLQLRSPLTLCVCYPNCKNHGIEDIPDRLIPVQTTQCT